MKAENSATKAAYLALIAKQRAAVFALAAPDNDDAAAYVAELDALLSAKNEPNK